MDRYHHTNTKESPPHQERRKPREEGLAWSNLALQQEGPALATARQCELPVSLSEWSASLLLLWENYPDSSTDKGGCIPAWVVPSQLKSSPQIN